MELLAVSIANFPFVGAPVACSDYSNRARASSLPASLAYRLGLGSFIAGRNAKNMIGDFLGLAGGVDNQALVVAQGLQSIS